MTAKPAAVNDAMLQLLWVLFSDANSRFNTLIEECAHLQDTVIGLTTDPALLDRIIHECAADDAVRGFSRVVCCQPKRSREYYRVCVRDRAFLSLWTLLGGLIIALDKNQLTHEETYRLAVDALLRGEHAPDAADDAPQRRPSDRVFWYIQTRGYFLTEVFRHYTTQLEHAHEKVIQMLENQPGKLPTPILLRRWNSAMYGEFLSEYSRHVNWEAHKLVSIAAGRDPADADASAKLTEDLSLTHTWTHQPTSMAQLFKVEVKTDRGDPARNYPHKRAAGHRFATVRSAYFYMEQPILLPLLYHECAHIAFSNRAFAGAQGDGHHPADVETFFSARAAAMQSLRMIKFPDGTAQAHYENFWDHFTEEVWADALALALGGRGYLVALALQLFGLSGEESFDHFDLDTDTVHELGGLGRPAKRKYPEPRPQEEVSYFWEARLQIACDLLAHRGDCRTPECDRRWISAIRDLLAGYARSGARAHAREGTSARHEVLWEYRAKLNDWVRNTTGRYLLQHFGALFGNSPVCTTYELATAQERRCLESLVRAYRQRYMPQFRGHSEFRLDEHHRLEHLPADIRWHVARDITAAMRASEACPPITSWQELAPTEPSSSARRSYGPRASRTGASATPTGCGMTAAWPSGSPSRPAGCGCRCSMRWPTRWSGCRPSTASKPRAARPPSPAWRSCRPSTRSPRRPSATARGAGTSWGSCAAARSPTRDGRIRAGPRRHCVWWRTASAGRWIGYWTTSCRWTSRRRQGPAPPRRLGPARPAARHRWAPSRWGSSARTRSPGNRRLPVARRTSPA